MAVLMFSVVPLVVAGLLSLTESTQRLRQEQERRTRQTATLIAARVATRTSRNRDQPVCTLPDGGTGMAVIDDIVQDDAAIGMDGGIDFRHGAKRRDDNRYLIFDAEAEIMLQPPVRHVDDLVDGKGGGRAIRMAAVVVGKRLGDLRQPFVELRFRPGIERRNVDIRSGVNSPAPAPKVPTRSRPLCPRAIERMSSSSVVIPASTS